MRIYHNTNVYDAAIKRIEYLFSEFDEVVVNFSGGKDSIVCIHLSLMIAKKLGRLPLKIMWIDQEVEWAGTVEMAEYIMRLPEVQPLWYQMPIVISNNASTLERFNNCWADGEEWMRPKSDISIKNNQYNETRFHQLFEKIFRVDMADKRACYISGVRAEESPSRFIGISGSETYKGITWGKILNRSLGHYTFYPIYDWGMKDVWKCIHDEKLKYNRVYDGMYRHGVSITNMRISNLHHETAIQNLMLVQEIEPETWEKLVRRIEGANTIKHLRKRSFTAPGKLPEAFSSWTEYAEHIIENLVQDQKNKDRLKKIMEKDAPIFNLPAIRVDYYKAIINTVLSNDWDLTKLKNFKTNPVVNTFTNYIKGKKYRDDLRNKYIEAHNARGN